MSFDPFSKSEEIEKPEFSSENLGSSPIPAIEPAYEHVIEPELYFAGLLICLLACLCVLWILLQGDLSSKRFLGAFVTWCGLGMCAYKALQGVRYGYRLRLYREYVELAALAPPQLMSKHQIACFKEFNYDSNFRRKVYLYLVSGEQKKLPRVSDPEELRRCLAQEVGVSQIFH